jgi:hypothetical protein
VYNLSVAKTRAYFVSDRDLLVHNVDCAPDSTPPPDSPPRPKPTLTEQIEEFQNTRKRKRPDQSELDKAIERAKKRHEAATKKFDRLNTPLDDIDDENNCSSCTLAALSDEPTVSKFLDKYKHVPGVAHTAQLTQHDEILVLMRRLGLRSDVTPRPEDFPPITSPIDLPFKEWDKVTRFMQESTANTFAISYEYEDSSGGGAHILIAIRDVDGSIAYLDFQGDPPQIVDLKAIENLSRINVTPTDVDWRSNRELYWHYTQTKYRPRQPESPEESSDSEGDYDYD